MKRGLLVAAFMLMARVSAAQTHPCDLTISPNPTVQSPVKTGFCHDGRDTSGAPIAIVAFKVYLDGSATPEFNGPLTPIGAPSATGFSYYETPTIPVTRGSHSKMVSAVSADGEGAKSAAFPFVVIAVPGAPVKVRVQ